MKHGSVADGRLFRIRLHADGRGVDQQPAVLREAPDLLGIRKVRQVRFAVSLSAYPVRKVPGVLPGLAAAADQVQGLRPVQSRLHGDGAGRPAGAQQNHFLPGNIHALLAGSAHKPGPVRVVADQLSLALAHRIDGADELRLRGQFIQPGQDGLLVGHGDVKAVDLHLPQRRDDRPQLLRQDIKTEIDHIKAKGPETVVVHHRGDAVGSRAADQAAQPGMAGNAGGRRRRSIMQN